MHFITILQYYSIVESWLLRLFFPQSIQVSSLVRTEPVLNTLQLSFIAKLWKYQSRLIAYPSYQSSLIKQIYKSLLDKVLQPLVFVLSKIVTFSASKIGLLALFLRTLLTLYVPLRSSKGSRILQILRVLWRSTVLQILKIVRILKVLQSKGSLSAVLPVFISQCQAIFLCWALSYGLI